MKKTIYGVLLTVVMPVLLISLHSCTDTDVDLPRASLRADKTEILSPAMRSDFAVNITANGNWEVMIDETHNWISASPTKGMGNTELTLSLEANEGTLRETTIGVVSSDDPSVRTEITVSQSASGDYYPIASLRALASNLSVGTPEYTIDLNATIAGVVNTAERGSNMPGGVFCLQDSKSELSGIMVRTEELMWLAPGDQYEIGIRDAVLTRDDNGVLEIRPSSDGMISQIGTNNMQLTPVSISYADYTGGEYESMYVAIDRAQVLVDELSLAMEESIEIQDENNDRYKMYTYEGASFYGQDVPAGSGKLAGIASRVGSENVILPTKTSDFALSAARFGAAAGIKLPYVFSLQAKGTSDSDGMLYNLMRMSDGSNWITYLDVPAKQIIEPTDGSGMNMTFWKATASTVDGNNGVRFRVSADNTIDNIISMQMWPNYSPYGYAVYAYPIGEDVSGTLLYSFSIGASNYSPRQWKIEYSTDNVAWTDALAGGYCEIPLNERNLPNFFTVPIALNGTLSKGSTLYIKLVPYSLARVNDASGTSTEGGELRLNSATILTKQTVETTSFPADAVYAEGFDNIYGGVDYLLGNKIANMAVYTGADIADWTTAQRAGMTGDYVSARPGYVQIGFTPFQSTDPRALVNNVGQLTTPALSSLTGTTNIRLSFSAMAYKTNSSLSAASDLAGDMTSMKIEVLNGGTIAGQTSAVLDGMNYSTFSTFSVDIDGATPSTRIRFTSEPDAGRYSRWFLDDVLVIKK